MNKIYIISGPAGLGKSKTSKGFAEQFNHCAYNEGYLINLNGCWRLNTSIGFR